MSQRVSEQPGQVSSSIILDSLTGRIFALCLGHRSQLSIRGEQIVAQKQSDEMKNGAISVLGNYEVAQGIGQTYSHLMIE